jgi:pantoate--beta-alanine ligase
VSAEILRGVGALREWRTGRGVVGLVPTMGALHRGHRALIERAARENDAALVSIFVNPTQFGPGEDYAAYPRGEAADIALAEAAGARAVYLPTVEDMYPEGTTSEAARVAPGPLAERLEGATRPGHFSGVATVVTRLFAQASPERAYFGQKDFQQLRVIQAVVRDRALPVTIVPCPTVREPDGLALSSRNAYLSPAERERAAALSRALSDAQRAFESGERDADALRERVRAIAQSAGELEYVSVADPLTLEEQAGPVERAAILLACRVGRARLIDNILVGMQLADLV